MNTWEKFWKKVDKKSNPNGCWEWTGKLDKDGYGRWCWEAKGILPHRFTAKYLGNMSIDGLFVCHKCDNPRCVNPDHLFVGTAADNFQDMVNKGRKEPGGPKKPIQTPKGIFPSLTNASKAFNVSPSTMFQYTKRYPKEFYYV